jgi:hypothetical protein
MGSGRAGQGRAGQSGQRRADTAAAAESRQRRAGSGAPSAPSVQKRRRTQGHHGGQGHSTKQGLPSRLPCAEATWIE